MIMNLVYIRNVEMNKIATTWISLIILRTAPLEQKNVFRKREQSFTKWIKATEHLKFDDQWTQHGLLPTFTKIYIFIFI